MGLMLLHLWGYIWMPSNFPSRPDDTTQPCLKAAALVKWLVFRFKIDMNDGDTMRLYVLDSLRHQCQPDTSSLPCRMHNYVDKHGVAHTVADDGTPCYKFARIIESAHCSPVTRQSGGIVFVRTVPADGLA